MRKLFGLSLLAAACSVPAHADQPMGPQLPPGSQIAIAIAPAKVRAPYDVQVIRQSGETLPTYGHKDRFYVQGNAGERYVIRVTNPTPNRVEAVVTVDGLDVIDGESGDLHKRGYVVPAYGDVRIEGFRTSHQDVATFRFSSVDGSYAGAKGKARNVGVIAVAIFEEQAEVQQQIILDQTPTPTPNPGFRRPYDVNDDVDEGEARLESRGGATMRKKSVMKDDGGGRGDRAPMPAKPAAAEPPSVTSVRPALRRPPPSPPRPSPRPTGDAADGADMDALEEAPPPPPETTAQRTYRPGLGTEFGEQRRSAAAFTRFTRGAGRPVAIAELRYNDAAGLVALGIHAQALPDAGELMTRETADPFPGDDRFARPPGR